MPDCIVWQLASMLANNSTLLNTLAEMQIICLETEIAQRE